MYCIHCGKQIEDNNIFCPYCGGGLLTSDTGSAKEALKKTAGAVIAPVKAIGNSVNEAANGQPRKYTEKVKETAKSLTDDVKQVVKDKNTSNFFTKNKYRNVKIIAVLLIAIFLLSALLGEDKGGKMAKEAVSTSFSDYNIKCYIKSVKEVEGGDTAQIYVVKFIAERKEGSAVVVIQNDSATILDVFPKSEYSRMEVYIGRVKEWY